MARPINFSSPSIIQNECARKKLPGGLLGSRVSAWERFEKVLERLGLVREVSKGLEARRRRGRDVRGSFRRRRRMLDKGSGGWFRIGGAPCVVFWGAHDEES